MIAHLDRLVDAVQANCHITDARHARSMTLCTYLLEIRITSYNVCYTKLLRLPQPYGKGGY